MKCLFLSDCPRWSETVRLKKKTLCSILKRIYWGAVVFLVVASHGTVWQLLKGASMITVFKDIFKNQPHCWIHLVLEPCSLLFPLEFLMLPSMALWKRAPRKPPRHQQDSKTVLCCSVGVLTLSACQWLRGCICNSVELKERSQPMIFFLFFVKINQPKTASVIPLVLYRSWISCCKCFWGFFLCYFSKHNQSKF